MINLNYKITEENNSVIIENIKDFVPKHIFDCGQCFRWNEEDDGSYTGTAYKKTINVKKEGEKIILFNTNIDDFKNIWYDYFDLNKDYSKIKNELCKDDVLKSAIKFGEGIRILNQNEWEILISFIISANNRIPMIKRAIEKLSEKYGVFLEEYKGKKRYSFPSGDTLSKLSEEEIRACGTGFRAKYILSASKIVSDNKGFLYDIKNLCLKDAREELIKFAGVGPKVADCIMLFSMNKEGAFPIDVWVKRVMEHFYVNEGIKLSEIQNYAKDKFGDLAGYAQQYLFYYARELSIGRNKK